jgi:methyl-accepting chemotaxis protein
MSLRISIRARLGATIVLVAIGLAALAVGSITVASRALTQAGFEKLTAIRDVKSTAIETYFTTISNQIASYAENLMTVEAMAAFDEAFAALEFDGATVAAATGNIETYLRTEFLPRIPERSRPADTAVPMLVPARPVSRVLQDRYLASNPNPVGEKDALSSAGLDRYDELHGRYHPVIRAFLQRFEYYDIFLVEPDDGIIVYSVFKETDYVTSLTEGPYRDTGIAAAFRAARDTGRPGSTHLIDFASYLPSYGAPASFISSPIYRDGELIGVLIFQMPVGRINAVMTNDQNWQDQGLGITGESYLVGADRRLRTESRFFLEQPDDFIATISAQDAFTTAAAQIEAFGTTILNLPIETTAVTAALRGETGAQIVTDYRGEAVLSSYRPLSVPGVNWALISEIDTAEAFAAITTIRRLSVAIAVAVTLILVAIVLIIARSITRPLAATSAMLAAIAEGEGDLTTHLDDRARDELGVLARYFNAFVDKLNTIVSRIKREVVSAEGISESLSASSTESSAAVHEITQNLVSMAKQIRTMDSTVQETSAATEEIQAIIGNLTQGITRQQRAVSDSSNATERMISAVSQVSTTTQQKQARITELVARAREGSEKIERTTTLITAVHAAADTIFEAVSVINAIADQTDLLAMNAAIEAAHAGESGRGFAVVAEEMRKLSETTKENSLVIEENITATVDTVKSALTATKETEQAYQLMHAEVEEFIGTFTEIGATMGELADGGSRILNAIEELTNVSNEVTSGSEQMRVGADEITRSILAVRDVSAGVSTGIDEIEAGVREISIASNDLAEQGLRNKSALEAIRAQVDGFRTT